MPQGFEVYENLAERSGKKANSVLKSYEFVGRRNENSLSYLDNFFERITEESVNRRIKLHSAVNFRTRIMGKVI